MGRAQYKASMNHIWAHSHTGCVMGVGGKCEAPFSDDIARPQSDQWPPWGHTERNNRSSEWTPGLVHILLPQGICSFLTWTNSISSQCFLRQFADAPLASTNEEDWGNKGHVLLTANTKQKHKSSQRLWSWHYFLSVFPHKPLRRHPKKSYWNKSELKENPQKPRALQHKRNLCNTSDIPSEVFSLCALTFGSAKGNINAAKLWSWSCSAECQRAARCYPRTFCLSSKHIMRSSVGQIQRQSMLS